MKYCMETRLLAKKSSLSYDKSRLKDLLWLLITEYQPNCIICNETFVRADILPSRGVDQLTEHHTDLNHFNNERGNRRLAHRKCHKGYHASGNINFWRQF